jgi:hypothetical protein
MPKCGAITENVDFILPLLTASSNGLGSSCGVR